MWVGGYAGTTIIAPAILLERPSEIYMGTPSTYLESAVKLEVVVAHDKAHVRVLSLLDHSKRVVLRGRAEDTDPDLSDVAGRCLGEQAV